MTSRLFSLCCFDDAQNSSFDGSVRHMVPDCQTHIVACHVTGAPKRAGLPPKRPAGLFI